MTLLDARVSIEGLPTCCRRWNSTSRCPTGLGGGLTDAVYSANTLHIMSWREVRALFQGIGRIIRDDGLLVIYGPFRYGGQYTSHSNAAFDSSLKARDPASGIRDFEAVDALAAEQRLVLVEDQAMPANNQTLVWRKS